MSRLVSSTRARVLTVAVSSAAVALLGLGAAPSASAAPQGSIAGTVTDADGAAIKGIEVTAYEFDGVDGWVFVSSTTTKNNGSYSLSKLPAADYTVSFDDADGSYVSEYYDDQSAIELADEVPVAQSQGVTGIDAELARTGSIRGTVTDEQGQPIPGIFVDILTFDENGFPTGSPNGSTTNASGVYVVPFIAPGNYGVGFVNLDGSYVNEYYDDHLSIFESDLVTVTPAGVTAGIDAELATGGHISGTVTDSGGAPLPGIELSLAQLLDGEWYLFGEEYGYGTGDDGTYDIGGLPAGTWQINFFDPEGDHLGEFYDDQPTYETATTLELASGGSLTGIDAELADAAHISGTVTDEEGVPLEDVSVYASSPAADGHLEIRGNASTGPDGTYSIDGLLGDTYVVEFQSGDGDHVGEFYDDAAFAEDAEHLPLAAGASIDGIDAELTAAAHITGTVTGADGEVGDNVGVRAYLWNGSQWVDYAVDFIQQEEVDVPDEGEYDLGGLMPGTYRLEYEDVDSGEHEFWDDQPSFELGQDVVVTEAGQVLEGYDVALEAGQYPSDVENLTPPAVSGSPVVGQTLTASPGTWNLAATTYHYQWFAGTTLVGTDSPAYAPTAADVGKAVTVMVTGVVPGLGSGSATSAPTAAVTAPPAPPTPPTPPTPPPPTPTQKQVVNVEKPVIKGTIAVGHRARVTAGQWTPAAVTLTYKWFVDGDRIANAFQRKLLLKEKWVGLRLTVKVIAKADGYLKSVVVTKRSAKIASG